mmetsp:Transcript_133805/g.416170  ORF Transcript_133805/g.416170 Transcript_133805/m.416170 type:complete len:391 (-) Transcript_133805:52-1224(-)
MSGRDPSLGHLLVEADAPTKTCIHPYGGPGADALREGQVLVHVAKLVVTSNTLTYAIAGKAPGLKYFQHFPIPADAPEKLAMPPCWGTGVVIASRCADLKAGARIHGLFPFSPTVVLTPDRVTAASFRDAAPHRAELIAAYSTYSLHGTLAYEGLSYDDEDFQMSTGNLFSTGWAMAHTAAVHPARPAALVLTSASSRTSQAAAFAAKFHKLPLQVIGLTSAANVDFVRSLGTYDVVCSYSDVSELQRQRVAVQDVAGNAEVQEALYRRFGDDLVLFGSVGQSHAGAAGRRARIKGLGGSRPGSFLVFTAMKDIGKAYGQSETAQLLAGATRAFIAKMRPSFRPIRRYGAEETQAVLQEMASGRINSEATYVCSLWPRHLHDPAAGPSKL